MNRIKGNFRNKYNVLLYSYANKQVKNHFWTNETNINLFGITINLTYSYLLNKTLWVWKQSEGISPDNWLYQRDHHSITQSTTMRNAGQAREKITGRKTQKHYTTTTDDNKRNILFMSAAMGIREKIRRQFCFYFCRRKGQIRRHYNGKNF